MKAKYYFGLIMFIGVLFISAGVSLAQEAEPAPLLNINVASSEELQALPGMNVELATAIIAARPYADLEGLQKKVTGISEEALAGIEVAKINVNSATLEELLLLPGVTQEIAQAIMAGRPYFTMEDLLNVEGISKEKLTELEKYAEATLEKKKQKTRGDPDD